MDIRRRALDLFRRLDRSLGGLENQHSRLRAARATVDELIEDADDLTREIDSRVGTYRTERTESKQRAELLRRAAAEVGCADVATALSLLAEARRLDARSAHVSTLIEAAEARATCVRDRKADLVQRAEVLAGEERSLAERSELARHEQAIRAYEGAVASAELSSGSPQSSLPTPIDPELDASLREELRVLLESTYRSPSQPRKTS